MEYRFQKTERWSLLFGHLKMGGKNPQGGSIRVNSH